MRAVPACVNSRQLPRTLQLISAPTYHPDRRNVGARCSAAASSGDTADVVATEALTKAAEPDSKPSKFKLWLLCIKPPMYAVAIAPMMLAAALAYLVTGIFPATCGDFTLGGILVIAWLNLSNDAFDALTGVDSEDRKPESIVNLTGLPWLTILGTSLAFLAAGVLKLSNALAAGASPVASWLLGVAIFCGYLYQGPPFRLSYQGLGEPLCFIAFGLCAVASAFTAMHRSIDMSMPAWELLQQHWALVVPMMVVCGLTTTTILFCSHFHQIQGDLRAGKNSPLVRLGTKTGCKVLLVALIAAHVIAFVSMKANAATSAYAPLGILAAPFAFNLIKFANENHESPRDIKPLKQLAMRWHIAMSSALFLALLTSGIGLYGAESLV